MEEGSVGIRPTLANVIDMLCAIEDEYVHQDIWCDSCGQSIVGVRFRCSCCEDFDLCSECRSDGQEATHNPSHSFYHIQYRCLSLPPANGHDWELLQRFQQGTTSRSFYLNYPWFFTPLIFESLISETPNAGLLRNFLEQLQGSLGDGVQMHVVLDAYIRLTAPEEWNWRQVQNHTGPLLELQLIRAEHSGRMYQLYSAMKDLHAHALSIPGTNAGGPLALRKRLFGTSLDSDSVEGLKTAMTAFLKASLQSGDPIATPTHAKSISKSARYIEMLSKGFDISSSSLPIFEEVEALLDRQKPGSPDTKWSLSGSIRRWQEYASLYEDLLGKMMQYLRRQPDGGTAVQRPPLPQPTWSAPDDEILACFTQFLLCRDYEAAAGTGPKLNNADFLHMLAVMCFYEARGDVMEAGRVAQSTAKSSPNRAYNSWELAFQNLFKVCEAYFCCYTQGHWAEAMAKAVNALDRLAQPTNSQFTFRDGLVHCVLELYCLKIFFLATRDRSALFPPTMAPILATRLRHLCQTLIETEFCFLAPDLFDLALHVHQQELLLLEIDQTEYLHTRRVFLPQTGPALQSLEDILAMITQSKPDRSGQIDLTWGMEASARLLLGYALVENEMTSADRAMMKDNLSRAWSLFNSAGSLSGQTEAALLIRKYQVDLDLAELPDWDTIETHFRRDRYFKGLIRFYEFRGAVELQDDSDSCNPNFFVPTGSSLYRQLLSIAREAGDTLLFRVCQLRSMRSWIEGPTFILLCEGVFHPGEGFLSDELFLEASRLLSQLYEVNNNFTESAAFSLLHLRLAHARHDPSLLDYATMLYFRCAGNMVSTMANDDRIYEVASLAFSFDRVIARSCQSILRQIEESNPSIPAGSLPIESLLWTAQLSRHIIEDNGIQSMSPQVILACYRSLKLAIDICTLLPGEYQPLFFAQCCHALGIAAEMLANPILSLLCYDLGQLCSAVSDGYTQALLSLKAGRRLSSWIYYDRPNFLELLDLAFRYLDDAVAFFWSEESRQSSYKNGVEGSLVLARAHLREVQCLIEDLDWGEDAEDSDDLSSAQEANKKRILYHIQNGLSSIRKTITRNLALRRQLAMLPAMQALENSRSFYFGDLEELYWNEMGLEMDHSRLTGDPSTLLLAIQKWKAVSLRDAISQRLGRGMVSDSVALGKAESGLPQLPVSLAPAEKLPDFEESSIWAMADIAKAHLDESQRIIIVDWTRYYDTLFIVAYNGTDRIIKKGVVELDYHKIENWVRRELGISSSREDGEARKRLGRFTRLGELIPILEKLEGFVKPGDLLVFCPAGILHAVPLQAIPFGGQGKPLIVSNPVVFCPSLSLLQTCVNNVQNSAILKSIPTAAFTRLGPGDPTEDLRVYAAARDGLADNLLQTTLTHGSEVTRSAFVGLSRGARLLHYHGHAFLGVAQRRDRALQLEPQPPTVSSPEDDGLLTVLEIFDLKLDSAVVVLLACASAEDDIAPNDDPLGLLSAFLYAGASSIVATRWPTQTSDARNFTKHFYHKAFASRKNDMVNLAVAIQATVVALWEDWDEDDPYHWAQFQLYGSWFGKI